MLRVLSLGAGVQSSTLALMFKHGQVPLVGRDLCGYGGRAWCCL